MSPSQNIEANNVVTMMCSLDPNVAVPPVIYFNSNGNVFCTIEHTNGSCTSKSSSCLEKYNASCPSKGIFSVWVPVSFDWNGKNISCNSWYSYSNFIILSVTGLFKFTVSMIQCFKYVKLTNSSLEITDFCDFEDTEDDNCKNNVFPVTQRKMLKKQFIVVLIHFKMHQRNSKHIKVDYEN